ncbi:MAG: hypothetical protein R8M37_03435 [Alphaproteobacteria bacterium]|nr:hypothetical protein [Alphaproteobacteria bacterium]
MYILKKLFFTFFSGAIFMMPCVANAQNIIDMMDLSPFVPIILDSFMLIATGGYEFFVGNGDGIIYILIWGFLFMTIGLSLTKMYLPKSWLGFLGISGGGEMYEGKTSGLKIVQDTLKPGIRAVIAVAVLLQLKPVFMTQWLVNPFLELGAIYTTHVVKTINAAGTSAEKVKCPEDTLSSDWITQESCEFLTQPVADISHANNQMIKRGLKFITDGLKSGLAGLILHGSDMILNIITGIILIFTFVSSNLFMALLIIQGIFNFGMQLILYPFSVLTYVAKPSDKWADVWPAFSGITKALQELIITMIACAFILSINVAVIKALFNSNTSAFVVAAGGSASGNIPTTANNAMGFGDHSIMWMSAILTFYLMFKIFNLTQEQLRKYIGNKGMEELYNWTQKDAKTLVSGTKKYYHGIKSAIGKTKK